MIMQTMLDKKMPLSMMADEMKIYPQVLKNIVVHDKAQAQANEKVKAAVKAADLVTADASWCARAVPNRRSVSWWKPGHRKSARNGSILSLM